MKTFFYLMCNDTKWIQREEDLPFTPYPGMNFENLAGDQQLKISGMSYDCQGQFFKLRLGWLTTDPLTSQQMLDLNVGWELVKI